MIKTINTKFKTYMVAGCVVLALSGCGKDSKIIEDNSATFTNTEKEQEIDINDHEKEQPVEEHDNKELEEEGEGAGEEIAEISLEGKAPNPLTGSYIDEEVISRRPIGVMISNIKAALPQSGIAQADVIYETLAEGGIPRLFAVFQDFDAEKIGPVRSARHYFLDFAFDFDAVYAHYGKSPQALKAFSTLNAPNMDGLSGLDETMCFQDATRNRPHSTYTSAERLWKTVDILGYRHERKEELGYKLVFNEEDTDLDSNTFVDKVELPFSYYITSTFEYDKESGLYKRFQYDKEHIDIETGEQLAFKNIIIQNTKMWVIPGDKEGRLDMGLVSEGTGYYITNGKYIPIKWKKPSHYKATKYYFENDEELKLNSGKTWIAVYPSHRSNLIKFLKE